MLALGSFQRRQPSILIAGLGQDVPELQHVRRRQVDEVHPPRAAMMAMSAVTGADVATCARAMATPGEVTQPDPELTERYAIGELQGELYDRLVDLFPRLR